MMTGGEEKNRGEAVDPKQHQHGVFQGVANYSPQSYPPPPAGGYPQPAPPSGVYPQPAPPAAGWYPQAAPATAGYPQPAPPTTGYPQPAPPTGGIPQPAPPAGGYPQPAPSVQAYKPSPQQYPPQYQTAPGYPIAEAPSTADRSLPCCGIGIGWFLFILGFFLGAIPWYAGVTIFLFGRNDPREKPGYVACSIAAIIATIAIILGVTRGTHEW